VSTPQEGSHDQPLRQCTLTSLPRVDCRRAGISRASAEQRAGRAGRTGPGHCFRLYSQSDLASFPEFTTPNIKRVGLEQLVLQILALGGGDPRSFDFLDTSLAESLEAAVRGLVSHEAVRARPSYLAEGREHLGLTPLGEVRCK
jgi:HrpA-like RNA helicase